MTKTTTLLTATVLTLFAFTASAEIKSELYPFAKELTRTETAALSPRFGTFEITEDIYQVLNREQSNLRIIDSNGIETPFLIRTKTGERPVDEYKSIPFKKLSFNKLPDNQIEIEMEKDSGKDYHNRKVSCINISSSMQNFEKNVTIWSSGNRTDWTLLAGNRPIFDYSKFIDIRNSRVSFPPTDTNYFRIRISNISEKQESPFTHLSSTIKSGAEISATQSSSFTRADFRIDEITFYEKTTRTVKDEPVRQIYKASDFSVNEKKQETLITFSTEKAPITKINLLISTPFFHRRFTAETSDDGKTWRTVHTGVISCASTDSDTADNRSITLPCATRATQWRITINNNDSPPLGITGLEVEGETREVIFYCDKSGIYRTIYGAEASTRPVYDIVQVLPQAEKNGFVSYSAGIQQNNPDYRAKPHSLFFLSRHTIMTIAVILMIVVLGWLIARTVKNIEQG